MFPDTRHARVFKVAPGADFPAALVAGLCERLAHDAPEAMARVTLIVNTARMRRRISDLFAAGHTGFLPRIRLVTDLAQDLAFADIPPAIRGLRRRLQLTQAIDLLLTADPSIAPRTALFDLADSLATLMDEMHGEGVDPAAIAGIDVSHHSAHWKRTQDFLGIMAGFFAADTAPDVQARQRLVVQRLLEAWQVAPPQTPIIIAGSTGSRGTTSLLMRAIARLPQGAVVLPGFDDEQPAEVWDALSTSGAAEDHPQYRFHTLLRALDVQPDQVPAWRAESVAPNPARNRLISLALRPAPITDQWMRDGGRLEGLDEATKDLTLIEAASPRAEALAISLILREAAENGQKAALITPDRGLSRMVTASLDRWGIVPDDSAGRPLALSPPGRFMRHIAALEGNQMTSEALLVLLKHPLTSSGVMRGDHLRWTRMFEAHIRNKACPYPTIAFLQTWAETQREAALLPWVEWLVQVFGRASGIGAQPLLDHATWHVSLAEFVARGPAGTETGALWDTLAGKSVRQVVQTLLDESSFAGILAAADYASLFETVLQQAEPVRDTVLADANIMIWGTLEARVQGADIVVLGGLNEGVWPGTPPPDPWLNRSMRKQVGLLLPDRQIGLAAHDFQQAIGVAKVVLSRARRNAEAETVASRWLNRLANLMLGLERQEGPKHLAAMRARGGAWLRMAEHLDATPQNRPAGAGRPAPQPPVNVRPTELPVTDMVRLIRDPYAIYAKRILRLRPMNALRPTADRLLKGRVLHSALEDYARADLPADVAARQAGLLAILQETLETDVAWSAARALWLAKMERAVGFLLDDEATRGGRPILLEEQGKLVIPELDFALTARPDRIDLLPDGRAYLIDYKTGTPPTAAQQKEYDKQLLFTAVMAARGAFGDKVPPEVAEVGFIGLGSTQKLEKTVITDAVLEEHWQGLCRLIRRYQHRSTGYIARRALFLTKDNSDFDHLSRFGEWDTTDASAPEQVGGTE